MIPVDEHLAPLDDYYLWCDHRAKDEAALITVWNGTGGTVHFKHSTRLLLGKQSTTEQRIGAFQSWRFR